MIDAKSRDKWRCAKHYMATAGILKRKPFKNAEKGGWLGESRNVSQELMIFKKNLKGI